MGVFRLWCLLLCATAGTVHSLEKRAAEVDQECLPKKLGYPRIKLRAFGITVHWNHFEPPKSSCVLFGAKYVVNVTWTVGKGDRQEKKVSVKQDSFDIGGLSPWTDVDLLASLCYIDKNGYAHCGESVEWNTKTSESNPSEPISFRVFKAEPNATTFLFEDPQHPNGPLDGYMYEVCKVKSCDDVVERGHCGIAKKLEHYNRKHTFQVGGMVPLEYYKILLWAYNKDYTTNRILDGDSVQLCTRAPPLVQPASTVPRGLEEVSIHCQDPIVPSTNITVASLSLCDEVQDCFQGADETKELCGNIVHIKLSAEERTVTSVTLAWSVVGRNSPWATSVEEQRTTLYGSRTVPHGLFVTTISKSEVVTPVIKNLAGRRFMIANLNSSTNYTFLVRPYINSTGSRRGYQIGKVFALSLTTETAGLQNLTSFHVDKNNTLVVWNAEGDADIFRINYRAMRPGIEPSETTIRSFPNSTAVGMRNKLFSILLPSDFPWSLYFTGVACGVQGCSNDTTLTIEDDKEGDPVVTITYIAATSPMSLYVNWTIGNYRSTSIDGFWVRCCEEPTTSCRVLQLSDESLTVRDLKPATKYNVKVQPRIRTRSGNVELGLTGEAQVSTWTDVPAHPTLKSYHVVTPPCLLHVDWTFYNSTVSYIQVSLENDNWFDCTTPAQCNAYVFENERESNRTTGSLMLWNLEYYTAYQLLLRGCNDDGCGSKTSIAVSTPIEASSAPMNLSFEEFTNGTGLVKWERPLQPRGPLDGYAVSWNCGQETTMEAMVTDVKFLITEPLAAQNCSASVLAYHITEEGHQLRGKEAHTDFTLNNTGGTPGP